MTASERKAQTASALPGGLPALAFSPLHRPINDRQSQITSDRYAQVLSAINAKQAALDQARGHAGIIDPGAGQVDERQGLTSVPGLLRRTAFGPADAGVAHGREPPAAGLRPLPAKGERAAIEVTRGDWEQAHDFADRLTEVRRAITELKVGPHGERLVSGLNNRRAEVVGLDQPLVSIREALSRHQFAAASPIGSNARLYGQAGKGDASMLWYDHLSRPIAGRVGKRRKRVPVTEAVSEAKRTNARDTESLPADLRRLPRSIVLGHELIHTFRSAHGMAVKPPREMRKVADDRKSEFTDSLRDLTTGNTEHEVMNSLAQHARLREEFETVGLVPVPKGYLQHPTENSLRREYHRNLTGEQMDTLEPGDHRLRVGYTAAAATGPRPTLRGPARRLHYGGVTPSAEDARLKKLHAQHGQATVEDIRQAVEGSAGEIRATPRPPRTAAEAAAARQSRAAEETARLAAEALAKRRAAEQSLF